MECNHLIQGEDWTLLPEKAVYWATEKTLIVSDLHLGKISHFRKSGLAVPFNAKDKNLEELSFLLLNYDIEQVIFLGDLFHSKNNAATALYSELFDRFPDLHLILVKGNHDIFDNNVYDELSLDVVNSLTLGPFYFTHEPEEHKIGKSKVLHAPALLLFLRISSHFAFFWRIYGFIYHQTQRK